MRHNPSSEKILHKRGEMSLYRPCCAGQLAMMPMIHTIKATMASRIHKITETNPLKPLSSPAMDKYNSHTPGKGI